MTTPENDDIPPLGDLPDIPGAETVVIDVHVSIWVKILLWIGRVKGGILSRFDPESIPAFAVLGSIIFCIYLLIHWISTSTKGLGDGITAPSFSGGWVLWAAGILLAVVIGVFISQWWSKRSQTKVEDQKPSTEKTKEAPKKKEEYESFNLFLLFTFWWMGVLATFAMTAYLLTTWLQPYFLKLDDGMMTARDFRNLSYLVILIPFLVHCKSLVDGKKKGKRPFVFSVAYTFCVIGLVTVSAVTYAKITGQW